MTENNLKFYDSDTLKEVSKKGYYQEKIDFFLNVMAKNKGKKILDVACNDGKLSLLYSKFGQVIGIDINKKALVACRKRGIECFYADATKLPQKLHNHFDIVAAGDIIEHIFDTDVFLKSMHTALKKDGMLLLTTPNLASFGRRIMLFLGLNPFIEYSTQLPYKEFNVGHIRYYTYKDLFGQLTVNRFRNIKIYGDRINIIGPLYIPFFIAKYFPRLSRNLMVYAEK